MDTRPLAIACLVAYGALAVVDVVGTLADQSALTRLLMVALMPLLAGFLWWSGPRDRLVRWVLVGLGFAWLGDTLGEPLLLKIAFFLGTQVAYCLAFRPFWRSSLLARPGARIAYVAVLGALVIGVSLQASGLLAAVIVYGASLALTVALATGVSRFALAGALTFLISDLVLAYGAFVAPPATPLVSAVVMATYLPAQLLIALAARRAATAARGATEGTVPARR